MSEENLLQRMFEISIGKHARIVFILPQSLETQSEDVDASFQKFETIAVDVNELSTHTLVWLQKLASQQLVNWERIVDNHLSKS